MISSLSMRQALVAWSRLEAAYHGADGFGGDTAEIYAYTLVEHKPSVTALGPGLATEASAEIAREAGANLEALLGFFVETHECEVWLDPTRSSPGVKFRRHVMPFDHRIHVRIKRSEP